MREKLPMRIIAGHLRFNLDAREPVFDFTEFGDVRLIQVELDGNTLSFTRRFHPALKAFHIFFGQAQHRNQAVNRIVYITDICTAERGSKHGIVVGQKHTIAVVDITTGRGQRLQADSVLVGGGGEVIIMHNLQIGIAADQGQQANHHNKDCKKNSTLVNALFLLHVF